MVDPSVGSFTFGCAGIPFVPVEILVVVYLIGVALVTAAKLPDDVALHDPPDIAAYCSVRLRALALALADPKFNNHLNLNGLLVVPAAVPAAAPEPGVAAKSSA